MLSNKHSILINNAGLILLHPFLQTLFEELHLLKMGRWIDKPSQHKAVLVTESLITGNFVFEDPDLTLNKILCGVDIDEIAGTGLPFVDEEIKECDSLLNAVIDHWDSIQNTSIKGLRESFLQREGIVQKRDNSWSLTVQNKGIDLLLNHLPWGIRSIKLPWMEEVLHVEWGFSSSCVNL